mmetsp:Transcript_40945/g.68767  ORF Transcript_40945/g.68767 Transcript_40945/m.68767 type:complete len:108 (+) Transcript_40945:162-485(+)
MQQGTWGKTFTHTDYRIVACVEMRGIRFRAKGQRRRPVVFYQQPEGRFRDAQRQPWAQDAEIREQKGLGIERCSKTQTTRCSPCTVRGGETLKIPVITQQKGMRRVA